MSGKKKSSSPITKTTTKHLGKKAKRKKKN